MEEVSNNGQMARITMACGKTECLRVKEKNMMFKMEHFLKVNGLTDNDQVWENNCGMTEALTLALGIQINKMVKEHLKALMGKFTQVVGDSVNQKEKENSNGLMEKGTSAIINLI